MRQLAPLSDIWIVYATAFAFSHSMTMSRRPSRTAPRSASSHNPVPSQAPCANWSRMADPHRDCRAEGASLVTLLGDLLNEMERLTGVAETLAGGQPELIRAKLTKQLEDLDREGRVDAERYAAEVALSAAKADVREELDRLAAHIRTGRELLKAGSPAGRKLDFLAQELNREANTLCSKSLSLDLTNAGLGLKGVIDQFKEQSANVE